MAAGFDELVRGGRTLDFFSVCEVPGCPWRVHLPERRCADHGGGAAPQFAEAADGDILGTRHLEAAPE